MPQETKPTITVGIPAYNEANNLPKLLNQLLAQQGDNYILDRIIVISDGSTDETINELSNLRAEKLEIIAHLEKKGKAERFVEIMKISESDILVQLDADVALSGSGFLSQISAEYKKSNFDLLCVDDVPVEPRTYVEKLSQAGIKIWNVTLRGSNLKSCYHFCSGRARVFSKNFYKKFNLPKEADVVEDKFSYLYAIKNDFHVRRANEVNVSYRLPANLGNYIKQMGRYRRADGVLEKYFGQELVAEESHIYTKHKVSALLKSLLSIRPDLILGYLSMHFLARIISNKKQERPGFEYVSTTKEL